MSESKENAQAAAAKTKGNEAYKSKNYEEAIAFYTEAIDLAPGSDVAALCLCNRAICFGVLKNWTASAEDAAKCVEIKPDWVKGISAWASPFASRGKHFESVKALETGVEKIQGPLTSKSLKMPRRGSPGRSRERGTRLAAGTRGAFAASWARLRVCRKTSWCNSAVNASCPAN